MAEHVSLCTHYVLCTGGEPHQGHLTLLHFFWGVGCWEIIEAECSFAIGNKKFFVQDDK